MRSKYFKAHELVPKHIYDRYGEDGSWRFIPTNIIIAIDTIKERFPKGTMTINNYYWGGTREWSGWRTPTSPYYSETSEHARMNAIDAVFSYYFAEEVREDIIANPDVYPTIKGIEEKVGWLHADCRNEDTLVIFKG